MPNFDNGALSKWYGRYYWICFSKTKPAIIQF